jgi:hypothetical protein
MKRLAERFNAILATKKKDWILDRAAVGPGEWCAVKQQISPRSEGM